MNYTKRFDEIGKDDTALAGGKGANLGELSRAKQPVPAGFVLTTTAYDAFVESSGIGGEIVKLASAPRTEDPAAFKQASESIQALFTGGEVPEGMAGELRAAYELLAPDGETAVAVRSSATAEDLERYAVVSDSDPTRWSTRLGGALLGGEVRWFDTSQCREAWRWVRH